MHINQDFIRQRSLTRAFFAALLLIICGLSVAATKQYPEYPPVDYGTGAHADLVKRGEELVKAGDCIACHTTEDGGKPFAGGLKFTTPFGTLYSLNITPDKETGIGSWSEAEFVRAMHEGISPGGRYYYPAFPYIYFSKITNDDLLAIWAYLHAIPAVHQQNKKDEMKWPFSWRFLQLGWRLLFYEPNKGVYKPNPDESEQWNRGAYLVQGLGHCSMCHSPSYYLISKKYSLAAPMQKYFLAGGFVDGFYAPNITSANLKDVPVQKIVDVFVKDKLISGGDVLGPMLEVNHDSLKYLSQEDLESIATYLKTVKSEMPPAPKSSSGAGAGKGIYEQYCIGCHGTGAGGAPKVGDGQSWAAKIALGMPELYKNAIHGIEGMPPKGNCISCTDKQIEDAVDYMVDKSKPKEGEKIAIQAAPKPKASLAEGKRIYTEVCSICHDKGNLGAPIIGDKAAWEPIIKQNMDVLFVRTINGYNAMPARGACYKCSDGEIEAAVKYMVEQSKTNGNYTLW